MNVNTINPPVYWCINLTVWSQIKFKTGYSTTDLIQSRSASLFFYFGLNSTIRTLAFNPPPSSSPGNKHVLFRSTFMHTYRLNGFRIAWHLNPSTRILQPNAHIVTHTHTHTNRCWQTDKPDVSTGCIPSLISLSVLCISFY